MCSTTPSQDEAGSECSEYGYSDSNTSSPYYDSSSDGCVDGVCDCCGKNGRVVVEPGETLDAAWWDARFRSDIEDGIVSEWVTDYKNIANFLLPDLDRTARTLLVGCGNSDFSQLLCTDAGLARSCDLSVTLAVSLPPAPLPPKRTPRSAHAHQRRLRRARQHRYLSRSHQSHERKACWAAGTSLSLPPSFSPSLCLSLSLSLSLSQIVDKSLLD